MHTQAPKKKVPDRSKRLAEAYNQIPNVVWTVLCLGPVAYYSSVAMPLKYLYSALVISLAAFFLPRAFFDAIHLSRKPQTYEALGIRFVKKFTQDGDLINAIVRKKHPHHRTFDNAALIRKHLSKGYFMEKFHFVLFLFFVLSSLYAYVQGHIGWGIGITVANLVYNVYPNLLQQYNRLRLQRIRQRHPSEAG